MAGAGSNRVPITCSTCGHVQKEPQAVISTVCRKCGAHIQVRGGAAADWLVPRPLGGLEKPKHAVDLVEVRCFTCGTVLAVPASAESTMCKRCSSHLDLRDYSINEAVSKNFRTHGRFVVKEKGYVFNTESVVGEAVIRGRFHGKLVAERRLEILTGAEIKGSFQAGLLVIPAGQAFAWREVVRVSNVEVAGELAANLHVNGRVHLTASARFFGDVEAGDLVVESGAVLVGAVHIRTAGTRTAP